MKPESPPPKPAPSTQVELPPEFPPPPKLRAKAFKPHSAFLIEEPEKIKPSDQKIRVNALLALGSALQVVGQPAYRIESLMRDVSKRLGLTTHVFSLPTGIFVSIVDEAGPHTHLLRIRGEGAHLERLTKLIKVADRLIHWEIGSHEAATEIAEIMKEPPRWGRVAVVSAYVLSAAAFSIFFRGGSAELLVAVAVGLVTGFLAIALAKTRATSRLFELTAAAAAALISETAVTFLGPVEEWIPLASGLIILLPGISLVDSVDELGNGHLAAGGARMAGVGVAFLSIAFGAIIGSQVAGLLDRYSPEHTSAPLPQWILIPAMLAIALGSTIRFRGSLRNVGTSMVGSMVALFGSRAAIAQFEIPGGPFLAAMVLGMVANTFARYFRRPPELISLPGIALLVPGSIGIKSLGAFLGEDPQSGLAHTFQMFMVAMALASGLLISNWIIRDRPPLPSDTLDGVEPPKK